MAKSRNIVLEGDYKNYNVLYDGKKAFIIGSLTAFAKKEKIFLDVNTVENIEILNQQQSNDTGSGIARGIVGGALLGGAGLVAGATLGKTANINNVTIIFRNGSKSLLEVDKKIFDYLFSLKWKLENTPKEELEKIINDSLKKESENKPKQASSNQFKILSGDFLYTTKFFNNILIEDFKDYSVITYLHNAEYVKQIDKNSLNDLINDDNKQIIEKLLSDENIICFEYKYKNGKHFIAISDQKTYEKIVKLSQKSIDEDKLTTKSTFKQGCMSVLGWFFGIIFTLAGLGSLPDTALMVLAGLIIIPPIGKFIENKINSVKMKAENFGVIKAITWITKNFGKIKVITCIILLFICGSVNGNSSSYKSAQTYIKDKNWQQAHETLISIKDYKDSKDLLKEVDYQYYVELGDKAFNNKNYSVALNHYKQAKTGFNDNDIEQKISKASTALEAEKKHAAEVQNAFKKAQQNKIASLKKQMKIKYDKVENTTWYYDKTYPYYANQKTFDLYMGESGSTRWLRLKITYAADDWLFFNKIKVNIDGENYEKSFNDFDIQREVVTGGGIYETIDIPYKGNEYLVGAIPVANKVIVRFEGKHNYYDMTLSNAKIQAFKRMLDLYDTLNACPDCK